MHLQNGSYARMYRTLLSEGAKDVTLTELPGKDWSWMAGDSFVPSCSGSLCLDTSILIFAGFIVYRCL